MINLRIKEKEAKLKTHPDFEFVPRGQENVMIVTWGGKSGTVYTEPSEYAKYEDYHMFIQASPQVVENLKSIEPDLLLSAETYARARNCYRADVVRIYTEKFGREDLLS